MATHPLPETGPWNALESVDTTYTPNAGNNYTTTEQETPTNMATPHSLMETANEINSTLEC